jgi:hypothetical protein
MYNNIKTQYSFRPGLTDLTSIIFNKVERLNKGSALITH